MNVIKKAILGTLKGALYSYQKYPTAMIGATLLAILTSIRIADDNLWRPVLFDKWQMIFVLTALIGLAFTAWLQTRTETKKAGLISLAGLIVILPLYFLIQPIDERIPQLTVIRVLAVSVIAVIGMLIIISYKQDNTDFNKRFFMLHKAFFIALLYMLVVMGGSNFIAAAVKALLYNDMPYDVYQHLSTWSAFLGFAFFLGNLPAFHKNTDLKEIQSSQRQARFIEVLFVYVMIPIIMVLSFVLLLWSLRMVVTGDWPPFEQLASIFSGYVLLGVWLTIMVADSANGLAKFFRRVYPVTAIVFLLVDAAAILRQINLYGIKAGEYAAIVIWIFAFTTAIFFLVRPVKFNHLTAWLAAALILVSVLPLTGFNDITAGSQTRRLRAVLEKNNMLQNDQIIAAPENNLPEKTDQILITEASFYLAELDSRTKLPSWFPEQEDINSRFNTIYGFQSRWDDGDWISTPRAAWVWHESAVIDVSEYQLAITSDIDTTDITKQFSTDKADYEINWKTQKYETPSVPQLTITRDNEVIIDQSLKDFLEPIAEKAKEAGTYQISLPAEDMHYTLDNQYVKVMIVFEAIDINWENTNQETSYNVNISALYFAEK